MKDKIEKAKHLIQEKLKDHHARLVHSYGVAETARRLAFIYHVNPDAAEIAGLFHDYAKYDPLSEQIKDINPDIVKLYQDYPVIFHAYAAAHALSSLLDIHDESILSAIRCHVWGKPQMTTLEKIVFVADFCEPSRPFADRNDIYDMATTHLDAAVRYCMKASIDDLEKRGLHPSEASLKAYQYYMEVTNDVTTNNY